MASLETNANKMESPATSVQKACGCFSMRSLVVKSFVLLALFLLVKETLWQEKAEAAIEELPSTTRLRPQAPPFLGTKVYFKPPSVHQKTLTMEDMPDLLSAASNNDTAFYHPRNQALEGDSWEEAIQGRRKLMEILTRAGLKIDLDVLQHLPLWSDVSELYGEEPVILGMDRCEAFRQAQPASHRFTGVSGQHNSGTNALTRYMQQNLVVPENEHFGGVLANVPWHKHGWVSMRSNYTFSPPNDHESVLPILVVRDPYYWFHSMCQSPYLMKWTHTKKHCPNLVRDVETDTGVPVWTKWGKIYERSWQSLAHVWSEFNGEYEKADFPRLIVRFEDLLFHTPAVLGKIRECMGAKWKKRFFVFSPSAVKQQKYFTDIKPQSSMLSAIIKYGQDQGNRLQGMTPEDIAYARKHLDEDLMKALHYKHPGDA